MAERNTKGTLQVSFDRLRRWNRWLAVIYFFQSVAIIILSTHVDYSLTTSYLTPDPVQSALAGHTILAVATRQLFMVDIGYVVAFLLFVSAAAHLLFSTVCRARYEAGLKKDINYARWIEYAVCASVTMIIVALLSGVYDITALLIIATLTVVSGLIGLVGNIQGKKQSGKLLCWLGAVVGFMPWLAVAMYLFGSNIFGNGHVGGYVYWIYTTIFATSIAFGLIVWAQHYKKGRWANYLYAEYAYLLLGLVVETALAWQVFAGVLRP